VRIGRSLLRLTLFLTVRAVLSTKPNTLLRSHVEERRLAVSAHLGSNCVRIFWCAVANPESKHLVLVYCVGGKYLAVDLVDVHDQSSTPPRDRCSECLEPLHSGHLCERVVESGNHWPQIDGGSWKCHVVRFGVPRP
jgi:hypothetical protein